MFQLQVAKSEDQGSITLTVQGNLVRPWVNDLMDAWRHLSQMLPPGHSLIIDCSAVPFADATGRAAIRVLQIMGCRLTGADLFLSEFKDEYKGLPNMTCPMWQG